MTCHVQIIGRGIAGKRERCVSHLSRVGVGTRLRTSIHTATACAAALGALLLLDFQTGARACKS